MPHRLFILSELYYPAETGTGFMMGKIAEGLMCQNNMYVLCGYPVENSGKTVPTVEQRDGIIIERCTGTKLNKDIFLLRTINLLTISITIFLKALRRIRRGDSVLVVTNPPSLPFVASIACKLRGAKCFLLIYDLYPEVLTATGLLRPDSVVARFLRWLNTWLYQQMDKVIVLGRDMYKIVARRFHPANSQMVIIPNWADVEELVPESREKNPFLTELHILDKFVIQYAGNMGRTHGIETIVEAAMLLQKEDVHFLFVGAGAKRPWLVKHVEYLGLNNVSILPLQPRQALCSLLNACDVAVISFIKGMAGISVPSRMYSVMSAGKPIIAVADDDSEIALVVSEEKIGWVVQPERPDLLAETILTAQANPELLKEMGQRARKAAEEKYSFQTIIQLYQKLLIIP